MKVPKTDFYKTRPFREKIGKKFFFKKIVFLVPYVGRKTAASGPSGEWTSSDDILENTIQCEKIMLYYL